jgi:hypothetical protein
MRVLSHATDIIHIAAPIAQPRQLMTRLSARNCCVSLALVAPSATRTAMS